MMEDNDRYDWSQELLNVMKRRSGWKRRFNEDDRLKEISLCLEEGGDIHVRDESGNSLLDLAVSLNYAKIEQYIQQLQLSAASDIMYLNRDTSDSQMVNAAVPSTSRQNVYAPLVSPDNNTSPINDTDIEMADAEGTDNSQQNVDPSVTNTSQSKAKPGKRTMPLSNQQVVSRARVELPMTSKGYQASGLKNTLHGNSFQMKLIMLFIFRGFKQNLKFRIATEMDSAEKFDDLVFVYENERKDEICCRLLQAKHTLDESNHITYSDLFLDNEGNFSLLKYLRSYLRTKAHDDFSNFKIRDCIICTNKILNLEGAEGLQVITCNNEDPLLDMQFEGRNIQRMKLTVDKNSKAYESLLNASELHKLAKVIIECEGSNLSLKKPFINKYHYALLKENVLELKKNTKKNITAHYTKEFIENRNLLDNARSFRTILISTKYQSEKKLKEAAVKIVFKVSNEFEREEEVKELPPIINDSDVSEFLDKLVFAVNSLNEMQLGFALTREIGEEDSINFSNPQPFVSEFFTYVHDWMKERNGRFLDHDDGLNFFNDLSIVISKLLVIGSTEVYTKDIAKFSADYKFNETKILLNIRKFLKATNMTLATLAIQTKSTILSELKVFQVIQSMECYKPSDTYIFNKMENIHRTFHRVLKAFIAREVTLLVLVTSSLSDIDRIKSKFRENYDSNNKKMIVIHSESNSSFGSKAQQIQDGTNFDDFKESSKQHIYMTPIPFLSDDNLIMLRDLFFNDLNLLDQKLLSDVIRGSINKFGNELQTLNSIEYYYIERLLCKKFSISLNIFKKYFKNDIFVVFAKLLPSVKYDNKSFIMVFDSFENAENIFKETCLKSKKNVHLLVDTLSGIVLYRSKGSTCNMQEYLGNINFSTHIGIHKTARPENKILDELCDQKYSIISDDAGTGKSTFLSKFSRELHKKYPNLWVVRLNLNFFTRTFLEKEITDPIEYLVNEMLNIDGSSYKLKTDVERKLFKSLIYHTSGERVAVILDGFDEICPTYKNKCLQFLKELKEKGNGLKYVWISTRPQEAFQLEKIFDTTSYSLLPFKDKEQIEFLTLYWQSSLKLPISHTTSETISEKMRLFATSTLNMVLQSLTDIFPNLTGIPLLLKIIAEAYSNECLEFIQSAINELNYQGVKIALNDLFEKVLESKYNVYQEEKNNADLSKPGMIYDVYKLYAEFKSNHMLLALYTYLSAIDFEKIFVKPDEAINKVQTFIKQIKDANEKTGIITNIHNDCPVFSHQTFVEFFIAKFFTHYKIEYNRSQFITLFVRSILCEDSAGTIRKFINSNSIFDIGKENETLIRDEITRMFIEGNDVEKSNVGAMFAMLLSEGCYTISNYLLDCLSSCPLVLKELLNHETENSSTALSSVHKPEWDLVTKLLEYGADISKANISLLHIAVETEYARFKWLLDKGANINASCEFRNNATPIMTAIKRNKFTIVGDIVNNLNFDKEDIKLVLVCAAKHQRWDILEYLLKKYDFKLKNELDIRDSLLEAFANNLSQKGIEDIVMNIHDSEDKQECYTVALKYCVLNHLNSLNKLDCKMSDVTVFYEWLINEKGADIHVKVEHYGCLLNYIAMNGTLELMKNFINHGAKIDRPGDDEDGSTILHFAIESNNLEIVEFLCERDSNLASEPNKKREPPIIYAAFLGRLSILKHLLVVTRCSNINEKFDIKTKIMHLGNEKYNLLQIACFCDCADVVEWLIDPDGGNSNMNVIYKFNEQTVLHKASEDGHLQTLQCLINGCISRNNLLLITQTTQTGDNILILAIKNGRINIVKYLYSIDNINWNTADSKGKYPCHHATMKKDLDMVKYFIEYLNFDIHLQTKDKEGDTMLHLAVERHHTELVKYLISKGANVNCISGSGSSVLYWSYCDRENWELAKLLLDKGADINRLDDGMTVFHFAIDICLRSFERFKFLFDYIGIDINKQTQHEGDTVLHIAVKKNAPASVIQHLLDKGADILIRNSKNLTAYELAVTLERVETIFSLLKI